MRDYVTKSVYATILQGIHSNQNLSVCICSAVAASAFYGTTSLSQIKIVRLILLLLVSAKVSCQEEKLNENRRGMSSREGEMLRLTIVSKVPTFRQRTRTQTKRVERPKDARKEKVGLLRQSASEAVVNRPEGGHREFDVLKRAKEGVWYRRVEDKEGVSLIRVETNKVILNKGQRPNEDLMLEDKEPTNGFWYRRVDNGDGGVRLVRVKNDDIVINLLKAFI